MMTEVASFVATVTSITGIKPPELATNNVLQPINSKENTHNATVAVITTAIKPKINKPVLKIEYLNFRIFFFSE